MIQETRRWDDNKEYSYAMRSKEDAKDYRYFPDPDLMPIWISDEWLEKIQKDQPEFQEQKKVRYKEQFGLPEYDIDIITGTKHMADLFEQTVALQADPKKVSNWLMVETLRLLKEKGMDPEDITLEAKNLAELISMVEKRQINQTVAKEIFEVIFTEDVSPFAYAKENGLMMVADEGALKSVVEEVIAANPQAVSDYKGGKEKALGSLVGQTMKRMQGKADPGTITKLLKEML